jgi:DNA-binding transcriptional regulator PaaX
MSTALYIIEDFLNDVGVFYELLNEAAFPPFRYIKHPKISKYQYHYKLGKFFKAGLVVPKKKGGIVYYELTTKARLIKNKYLNKQRRNDGLSSLIAFDIPAKFDRERTIFRRFLLRNGYILLQKSLLISPNLINQLVLDFAKELKIDKFLTIGSVRIEYNR